MFCALNLFDFFKLVIHNYDCMYQILFFWKRIIHELGSGGGERECRKMLLSDVVLLLSLKTDAN